MIQLTFADDSSVTFNDAKEALRYLQNEGPSNRSKAIALSHPGRKTLATLIFNAQYKIWSLKVSNMLICETACTLTAYEQFYKKIRCFK